MTKPRKARSLIDVGVLQEKLQRLEGFVKAIETLQNLSLNDFEKDLHEQWKAEHGLQLAIQVALDIGNHLISGLNLERPKEYRQTVLILGRAGVLSREFAEEFSKAAGFRNILIHEYADVDPRKVHAYLKSGPADFRKFIQSVTHFLRRKGYW